VFDKNNRKLWDARLNYGIGPRFTSGIYDPDIEATPGAQPVLQNNTRLYFFDQGTLTAFDTRDGRVAWRLPSVGITQVVPAGSSLYVASTTAGPESIQYSKDVTLNEKIAKVLHKVDAATGKIEWSQERIGEEPKVSGKFLYVSLKRTYLIDTIGDGDARPHYFFRRLDPSNGRQVWEYYQRGHAEASEVHENVILLRFLDELRVLKFMAL
jgi:outer membrane protein assembly factor BamB